MQLFEKIIPEITRPLKKKYFGEGVITAREEVEFKVNGSDILNLEVPEGKVWNMNVHFEITETDIEV